MQKHKKTKTCKKSNKIKKCTFAPAISTSHLFENKMATKKTKEMQKDLKNAKTQKELNMQKQQKNKN